MTSPRRGRTVAIIAGLAALAVLGAGLASWRAIALRWHLARLEGDPGLLLEHVASPEGSVRREAARAFVRTPAGGEALLGLVVRESRRVDVYLDRVLEQWLEDEPVCKGRSDDIVRNLWSYGALYCHFWYESGILGDLLGPARPKGQVGLPALREVQTLLAAVAGRDVTLSGYPGLLFTVLPREEAEQRFVGRLVNSGFSVSPSGPAGPVEWPPHVCLVRRAPSAVR
ncbi:MAG: hypothetical protein HY721_10565 [Planctomycetes bacterium]|nr:hypothetical protein [Planctomycetota bacterium]